jgi:hypothetical protein
MTVVKSIMAWDNMDFITEEYLINFLNKQDPEGILALLRDAHFHPDRPENHSICITNMSKKRVLFMNCNGPKYKEGREARSFLRSYINMMKMTLFRNYNSFRKLKQPNKSWDNYMDKVTKVHDLEFSDLKPFFELLYKHKDYKKMIK